MTKTLSNAEGVSRPSGSSLDLARKELDVLRKAQLILNSSGVAPYEDRRAVAGRVMEVLYEVDLLEREAVEE